MTDAYDSIVFCSRCGEQAKVSPSGRLEYSEGFIKTPVCWGGCDATTPAHEPTKLIDMLDELVAAAKNEMAAEIESSVLSDLPRNPVGMSALIETTAKQYEHAIEAESMAWLNSPFYKIMQQRNAEIRLLYGTMTNYWMVMEHKPQPEGVTCSRINTQQERETNE